MPGDAPFPAEGEAPSIEELEEVAAAWAAVVPEAPSTRTALPPLFAG
jgi:hypothetical protein